MFLWEDAVTTQSTQLCSSPTGSIKELTRLIFAVPVMGLAAGRAGHAYLGAHGASNDFEAFRDQVGNDLQPGGAALLLLAQSDARERAIHDHGRLGGAIRSTDHSDQQRAEVRAEFDKVAAS